MQNEIRRLLELSNAHPFLFVGSGFTHRYLGTDDWKGLISRFATQALPGNNFAYEWYRNEIGTAGYTEEQLLPLITQRIEKDFNSRFLSDASFTVLRSEYERFIRSGVSAFKIAVAHWFKSQETTFSSPKHDNEISALGHSRKNIAGIVTTNFDQYLETLFPDHIPYIGQDTLLFTQTYGIGEIYKIHGCVSDPESIVLTHADYERYSSRNAYLSAKLLTIFLEHPIFFIGYSLNDINIRLIFKDIADCLNDRQLENLSNRLFFVQRVKDGRPEGISIVRDTFDTKVIEFKRIVTDDFSVVYKAIAALRTSYSPKILRKLKKDIYELIATNNPKERIRVIDIENADNLENVEYVMGVGVAQQLAGQGYAGLEVKDLIEDLIIEDRGFDAKAVIATVLPKLGRQCTYNLPVFKYLSQDTTLKYRECKELETYVSLVEESGAEHWITKSMQKMHKQQAAKTIQDLYKIHEFEEIRGASYGLMDISFLPTEKINLDDFKHLLADLYIRFAPILEKQEQGLSTNFRRAVKIYDWLQFGQKKTPLVPKDAETD